MNAFEQAIMGVPDDELFNLYRAGSAMKPSHVQGTPVASHTPMPVKTDKQVRQALLNRMFPKEQTEATEQGLKYMTMGLSEAPLNQLEDIVTMSTAESEADRKAAEERYLASVGQNIAGMVGSVGKKPVDVTQKDMLQFPKGDSYGIQNDGARLNGDVLNTVADSTYQTTVPGPSAVNNQKVSLRQPENAKKWLGDRDLVTLSGVDINNPQPGAILVHSAQAPGLDVWNTSKADPSTYSGLNKSKSFWGASQEGATLHQQDRASAGDNLEVGQYIIRADNPVAIPFQGSKKTQDALIAAREAGHDVAILHDSVGNRNVVHLKPEQGGVKNVKNTGEWSESPSMLHGLAATVGLSIPLIKEYLAADEKKKRLMESRSGKFKELKNLI